MKSMRELAPYQGPPRGPMRGTAADGNPIRRMPGVNPEQTFFHFDLLRALEMHRGLALGIFLAGLVACGAYLARRWNNYTAESLVYVQPAPPHLLENGQGQQSWPFDANTYESYIQQQIHNVTREDVLAGAVQRIPDFQGTNESEQAAADRLGGNIKVDRVSTGYQIAITATAGSAAEAAQMANAVAESFIGSTTRELRSGDRERIALLGEERDRVMKEMASDRAEQDSLNKELGVASVGAAPDFYDDQIAAIRAELVKARTDNDEAAAKLTATAGGGATSASLDAAADEIVSADPGLVSMKTALNKRRSDLISQMSNLTPQHPVYKQDAQELAKINSSLDAMTKDLRAKAAEQIEQRLKSDLERTSGVEDRLNAQLAHMTSAAGSATPRLQRANDLATDIARLQARYTLVDEQYRNLTIDNAAPGAVYLSAPAIAPLHADRKKIYRNALILLLAGIIFALAAALIAHNLDPRIYIAADVERVLGFAPMALLPDLYEVGTGIAEEYMLRLAAAVEHAHQQGHLNSCIFTGVTPGAGATTVSARVSSMLQAMGRPTALVDAVGAARQESEDAGMDLVHLPRGSRSTALLQQMTGGNDDTIVVTDTAPLPISAETEYLARFVDSAIVVIESGTTTKAQLREVAQSLERLDVSAVGFVLNRISMAKGNAAFRHSVHAVERHLKAQARTVERKRPRGVPADADASETADRPSAQHRQAVSEPAYEPARAGRHEENPESGKKFVPEHETMFVNQPQAAAEDGPSAREIRTDAPVGRQTENWMPPEMRENSAAGKVWREGQPDEPRMAEADGFLPWEAEDLALLRAHNAGNAAEAYGTEAVSAGSEPFAADSAAESASEVTGWDRSDSVAPQDSAAETSEHGVADETREARLETLSAPEQPAPAQPAPPDRWAKPASISPDSGANRVQSWTAIAAKPARGREGVQVVLGGARSAPLTGEAVPDAWRERLRSEAEAALPAVAPQEQASLFPDNASVFPDNLDLPQRAPDPFRAMKEAEARRAPLKEWWEELAAPLEQERAPEAAAWIADFTPQAAQAAAPEVAPVASAAAFDAAPQEVVSVAPQAVASAAAPHAGPITEEDEALYNAASRLSGLRNLLVSLGIQTLHQGAEQRKAETEGEARAGKTPERVLYPQPVSPEASGNQPADSVTARPEIIPPRLLTQKAEREKAQKTPAKSPRVSSWESPDDVDTLPSRRGQYRRNH